MPDPVRRHHGWSVVIYAYNRFSGKPVELEHAGAPDGAELEATVAAHSHERYLRPPGPWLAAYWVTHEAGRVVWHVQLYEPTRDAVVPEDDVPMVVRARMAAKKK